MKRVQTPGGNASVSLGNDQVRYERPSEAVVSSSGQHTSAVLSLVLVCDRTKPLSLVPLPETVMSSMRKRLLALSHAIRKALAVKHTLSGVGFDLLLAPYWLSQILNSRWSPVAEFLCTRRSCPYCSVGTDRQERGWDSRWRKALEHVCS